MKKALICLAFLLILILAASAAPADVALDAAHFPSDAFRSLLGGFDLDHDGLLSDTEIAEIREIDCQKDASITTLKGLEYFPSLTSLSCWKCPLRTLDLSANTQLDYLDCCETGLSALDVTHNPKLMQLWAYGNKFTTLDLSNCPNLVKAVQRGVYNADKEGGTAYSFADEEISAYLVVDKKVTLKLASGTQVTPPPGYAPEKTPAPQGKDDSRIVVALDETHFPDDAFRSAVYEAFDANGDFGLSEKEIASASSLSCPGKEIASLKGVEYLTALTSLECFSNKLTSLDVSHNTALTYLNCWDNQLKSLDVSALTSLSDLRCSQNALTKLNLKNNSRLKDLRCYKSGLTSLDLSKNTALERVEIYENSLTSLTLGKLPALTYLDCYNNQLTALDPSGCGSLTELRCFNNQLTSLNVASCGKLVDLRCSGNRLSSLDVTSNAALEELYCWANPLSTVDVSKNRKLRILDVSESSGFSKLNVSGNPNLMELWCFDTAITELDLSRCPYLSQVAQTTPENYSSTADNYHDDEAHICLVVDKKVKLKTSLAAVDINETNFPDPMFRAAVTVLDQNENGKLSSEEISAVTTLNVSGLGIASLEGIEHLKSVSVLNCANNALTTLDVGGNARLKELDCRGNQLTEITFGGNAMLEKLICFDNRILRLDVSRASILAGEVRDWSRKTSDKGYDYIGHQKTVTDYDAWGRPTTTRVVEEYWLYFDRFTTVVAGSKTSAPTSSETPQPTATPEPTPGPTDTAEPTDSPEPTVSPQPTPAVGDSFTVSGMKYQVTAAKAVRFSGLKKAGSKTSVSIPKTVSYAGVTWKVTEIAAKALYKDSKITRLTVGANVKKIGKSAFEGCKKLKTVQGGAAVTQIGEAAFRNDSLLSSVSIGQKVKTVGKNAFSGCKKLKTVTYAGKAGDWKKISIKSGNGPLTEAYYNPTKITPEKKSLSLAVGKKKTLAVRLTPGWAKTTLTWKSSNKKVATVSSKGVVQAVSKGTATITVTTKNGLSAKIRITVK